MGKTIQVIKEKRTVPEEVREKVKHYTRLKKKILTILKEGPKTIPEIASELDMDPYSITYYLMSLRKFGDIEVDRLDDMDEYFYYKLKQQ